MSMIPTVFDKRPPYVRFEEREFGIDVAKSEEAGRPVPRMVVMACITPHASKDVFEKPAEEWLVQIKQKASRGDFPPDWAKHFRDAYEEWKSGNELPREGTPVKTWQMTSREQANRLIAVGITTVEDLAETPDQGTGVIGLDGRYLRDMARTWVNEAKDKGISAKALADANVRIADLENRIRELTNRMNETSADEGTKRGPGRPRKQETEAA